MLMIDGANTDDPRTLGQERRRLDMIGERRPVRRGRERLWTLEPAQLQEARRYLDLISQSWDERLERLKEVVER